MKFRINHCNAQQHNNHVQTQIIPNDIQTVTDCAPTVYCVQPGIFDDFSPLTLPVHSNLAPMHISPQQQITSEVRGLLYFNLDDLDLSGSSPLQ